MNMKMVLSSSVLAAMVAFYFGSVAHAQQPVTIALSTVGNPGNAADTTGYGGVGYTFGIGTYDVTLTQYTAFLNAVAQTDTYGLYDTMLAANTAVAGIQQSGSSGSYTYSIIGNGQRPVTYVSWFDAARFCNWMNNGEPQTHVENASTTEDGAYTLSGTMSGVSVSKNLLAQWYIPSESEWYKAAYYDQSLNSGLGGYWTYATRSNSAPGNLVGNGTNQANYYAGGYSVTQIAIYSNSQNYLTSVGAFTNSASAYGTYDQAGNVFNWTDSILSSWARNWRGGSWTHTSDTLAASYRNGNDPTFELGYVGFRVANAPTPEPTSLLLIGLGSVMLASLRRKATKK